VSAIAQAIGPQRVNSDGFDEWYLPRASEDYPATMLIYAVDGFPGSSPFGDGWRNFLDLASGDHPPAPDGTIIADIHHDANVIPVVPVPWTILNRSTYDGIDVERGDSIRLVRVDTRNGARVVVDRFDGPDDDEPDDLKFVQGVFDLSQDINDLPTWQDVLDENGGVLPPPNEGNQFPLAGNPNDLTATHWVQWRSAVRAWGYDHETLNGASDPDEINPRYISAAKEVRQPVAADGVIDNRPNKHLFKGNTFTLSIDPDDDGSANHLPWFTRSYVAADGATVRVRKPTFFDMNHAGDLANPNWSYPDKGYYHSAYSLQMLQKDWDFQQVGELLNVWLYGHELRFSAGIYDETTMTFSERIRREQEDPDYGEDDRSINRLRYGEVIGAPTGLNGLWNALEPLQGVPALPAGLRVLDAFVCDGPGVNYDPNVHFADEFYFSNAGGFTGRPTPGLINVNTAPVEVLRMLPHWYKLVHNNPTWDVSMRSRLPRSALPEALLSYRERWSDNGWFAIYGAPDYSKRDISGIDVDIERYNLRAERGIASLGELGLLLNRPAQPNQLGVPFLGDDFLWHQDSWKVDFAAENPFELQDNDPADIKYGGYLSTDVITYNTDVYDFVGDRVAADSEEANLLFAGASNLVTTRSDVFTVYFRIRSFRQNPTTRVWDATDPEYIVDDSRYVMLVDRSEVNHPTDKPKILYLEKLPN
jgi:hypothetical protein